MEKCASQKFAMRLIYDKFDPSFLNMFFFPLKNTYFAWFYCAHLFSTFFWNEEKAQQYCNNLKRENCRIWNCDIHSNTKCHNFPLPSEKKTCIVYICVTAYLQQCILGWKKYHQEQILRVHSTPLQLRRRLWKGCCWRGLHWHTSICFLHFY